MARVNEKRLLEIIPEYSGSLTTFQGLITAYRQNVDWKAKGDEVIAAVRSLTREGLIEESYVVKNNFGIDIRYPAFRKSRPEGVAQIPSSSDARQSQTERDIADVIASAPREFERKPFDPHDPYDEGDAPF